jgi:periplasmic copper chaperone A
MAIGAMVALMMATSIATAHTDHHENGTPEGHRHGDETMGSTGNGVLYLTITNAGDEDDALIGGETDRAERMEIHETIVADGSARMQPAEGALPIPSGETVTLEPGGLHIMLVNLTADIPAGDRYEVTLTFERAGDVTLGVPVRRAAEPAGSDEASETVEVGDLSLEGAWSRPAPRLTAPGSSPTGTPEGTPASQGGRDSRHA